MKKIKKTKNSKKFVVICHVIYFVFKREIKYIKIVRFSIYQKWWVLFTMKK